MIINIGDIKKSLSSRDFYLRSKFFVDEQLIPTKSNFRNMNSISSPYTITITNWIWDNSVKIETQSNILISHLQSKKYTYELIDGFLYLKSLPKARICKLSKIKNNLI